MNAPRIFAIDGPAASGKTTVGLMLAEALNLLFLDTGCMYRAVTLAVLRRGLDVNNESAVVALTLQTEIAILPPADSEDGRSYTVLLDGQDVTWELRSPQVDASVSIISAYPEVRSNLVSRQRDMAKHGDIVMVGRDIGTVVLPDAPQKYYVTASAEERARRRWRERLDRGEAADYETILADVIRRDAFDSNRRHSPLRPADDAIILDTTNSDPQSVVAQILTLDKNCTPGSAG